MECDFYHKNIYDIPEYNFKAEAENFPFGTPNLLFE